VATAKKSKQDFQFLTMHKYHCRNRQSQSRIVLQFWIRFRQFKEISCIFFVEAGSGTVMQYGSDSGSFDYGIYA
jgi:hypothetical protein